MRKRRCWNSCSHERALNPELFRSWKHTRERSEGAPKNSRPLQGGGHNPPYKDSSRFWTFAGRSEKILSFPGTLPDAVKKILCLLLLFCLAGPIQAETRYVTDQLKITLRSGESNRHRILKMLPSGTPVEILADNPKTGYSKVRLANGTTGYVLTRQLLREPVARDRLTALQKRIQELEASPNELRSRLAQVTREYEALKQAHQSLQSEKDRIERELAELKRTAANAVQIAQERRKLRKQVATMTHQLADQEQEIRELKNSSAQRWFLIGGGVLFGGILLGLILPRLRVRRRRDSWGSL